MRVNRMYRSMPTFSLLFFSWPKIWVFERGILRSKNQFPIFLKIELRIFGQDDPWMQKSMIIRGTKMQKTSGADADKCPDTKSIRFTWLLSYGHKFNV